MNLIKGLKDFKDRRKLSNAELSRMLGVSDSMVSQYLSGKSGMSPEIRNPADPLQVVVEGLRKILEQVKTQWVYK